MVDPAFVPEIGSGAVAAVIVTELIELLKKSSRFSFINYDSQSINRLLGGLMAFATGLGLQFNFDPNTHTLMISGLMWTGIIHGLVQWAGQQAYYRIAVARKS